MITQRTFGKMKQHNGYPHQRGFTLIELMLVVSIIAIVAAIAVPAVSGYLAKARRSDARSLLMQIQGKQEQFFLNNRSYTDNFTLLGDLAAKSVDVDIATTENGYYEITMTADRVVAGRIYEYTLTATPVAGKTQANDVCTTLTVDQNGNKDFTPPEATGCW